MPTEKKLTKEDTWKPAELTKHMRDAGHGDRRREERERRARDNTKEEERESRRARDNKDEERERRRSRDPREERHVERKSEGAEEREKERRRREGGAEREKGRRREGGEEREKERRREGGAEREKERREGGEEREKERRREGEEREKERRRARDADTRGPDRGPQRHREGERERHKDRARERDTGDEKEKRREEREGHRRREGGREREGEEREKHKEREHREEGDRRHDERPDKARRVRRSEEKEEEKNKEPRKDGDRRRKQEDGERGKEEERERRREKEERRREKEDGGGRDEERERRHRERRQRQVEDVGGGVSTELREPEETKAHHHGDQDTGEKERRRASRHPVLPEAEAAGADVPPAASERKAAAEPESAHGEPAYEDDFEEYEEDFEELDESGEDEQEDEEKEEVVVESPRQKMGAERRKEVEAIQRAMEEENRRAAGGRSGTEGEIRPQESEQTRPGSPHRGSQRGPQRGKFIDFVAAKQREINQKVASQQKKRSTELLRLVELDFSPTVSLLDLPPLSQYDVYIKSFGNTNTKQAYVQCREDDGERDVQTDLIEVLDRWTQHPADHTGACGEPGRSQDAPDGNTAQINIDSQRLATFLHSAVQVMSVLLEEDHAERRSLRTTSSQTDALSFSEGNLQLNTQLPFLHGRPCSLLLFSASQRQTLLSVHGPLAQPGAVRLDSWTLLCVWSMWEPSRPQKVLVYESEVRCCCFSPGRGALVLAGTSDGSLVLWDLREPAGGHHTMTVAGTEWTFRQPTFSTDAVLSALGHHSAVNTIAVLPSPSSTTSSSSTAAEPQPPLLASEESAGTSFQLASLDERGVLNLWVVLELTSASLAGSQTDLGLRPGGKVKLLHSSCMPAVEREGADLEALQLHFLPSDANHFLITTNMGVVHHGTVHGFRSPPRDYGSQEGGSRPLNVTSLHFSPFNPQLFLVGCSDGSMRLHIVSSHWPLAEWTTCRGGGAPELGVVSVRWSQSRPAVFCVLDSASHLHLWDLSRDALGPVATETLHADGVTAMAVFGSASSSSSSSSNQSSFSGVALAHRTGKLQLHYFNPSFSSANHAEDEGVLQSMMHQAL
ncbi:cytoplasmic dynein 2 intermediate chain 1 isoform X2 [Gadus macrocephalus]|uniref:cytoplasmic dynein 2 intermediate chain 1 isoform X2 n=1 Tax=Gadus macrocephalus TaxID=80720 RepID=UPI0028CB6087|nr:cytoplasmic dynein 2 intermediate chain 1 isoform X2 [Gadus macrocephalus]